MIKSAITHLTEDINLLERHKHIYQFGNSQVINPKEKMTRIGQVSKLVEEAKPLIDQGRQMPKS